MKLCLISTDNAPPPSFLVEILTELGELVTLTGQRTRMLDESLLKALQTDRFDRHIIWHADDLAHDVQPLALSRSFVVPAISFPPAVDRDWRGFASSRFLSLTRAQHEVLQRTGCASYHFQYYPESFASRTPGHGPVETSAVFVDRQRLNGINLRMITMLCRALGIPRLEVHVSTEAGPDAATLRDGPIDGVEVRRISVCPPRADHLIYFSSPRSMGLDMDSIEAMARGCVVISPDTAAMRDYIAPGTSGLLYDPSAPFSGPLLRLEPDQIAAMRRAALRKTQSGHRTWVQDRNRLASVVADDGRRWSSTDYSAAFTSAIRQAAHERLVYAA